VSLLGPTPTFFGFFFLRGAAAFEDRTGAYTICTDRCRHGGLNLRPRTKNKRALIADARNSSGGRRTNSNTGSGVVVLQHPRRESRRASEVAGPSTSRTSPSSLRGLRSQHGPILLPRVGSRASTRRLVRHSALHGDSSMGALGHYRDARSESSRTSFEPRGCTFRTGEGTVPKHQLTTAGRRGTSDRPES